MIVALWIIFAVVGAALLIAPQRAYTEVARVTRTLNEQSPQVGKLLIRLLGLALFLIFGLALASRAGLFE